MPTPLPTELRRRCSQVTRTLSAAARRPDGLAGWRTCRPIGRAAWSRVISRKLIAPAPRSARRSSGTG